MNILNIISIVCFTLCLIMFFYFRWYIKKRTVSSGLNERQIEVARLIAEIDRITDRDSQLVEERIVKLKAILDNADKRIAVYVKELEKSKKSETLYASLGKGIRDVFETNEDNFSEPPPGVYTEGLNRGTGTEVEDRDSPPAGSLPVDTIKISSAVKTLSSSTVAVPPPVQSNQISSWQAVMNEAIEEPPTSNLRFAFPEVRAPVIEKETLNLPPPSRQQLRSHIDLMIDDGIPAEEIASHLGISVAEVNLAKNLRRKK